MEILKKIDDLLIGWGISPSRADMFDQFIAFALILAVAFLADALCRKILLKVVAQLVKKTKATWDDIVFDRKVMVHLSRMVAPVIIYLFVPLGICRSRFIDNGFHPAYLPYLHHHYFPEFRQLVPEGCLQCIQ